MERTEAQPFVVGDAVVARNAVPGPVSQPLSIDAPCVDGMGPDDRLLLGAGLMAAASFDPRDRLSWWQRVIGIHAQRMMHRQRDTALAERESVVQQVRGLGGTRTAAVLAHGGDAGEAYKAISMGISDDAVADAVSRGSLAELVERESQLVELAASSGMSVADVRRLVVGMEATYSPAIHFDPRALGRVQRPSLPGEERATGIDELRRALAALIARPGGTAEAFTQLPVDGDGTAPPASFRLSERLLDVDRGAIERMMVGFREPDAAADAGLWTWPAGWTAGDLAAAGSPAVEALPLRIGDVLAFCFDDDELCVARCIDEDGDDFETLQPDGSPGLEFGVSLNDLLVARLVYRAPVDDSAMTAPLEQAPDTFEPLDGTGDGTGLARPPVDAPRLGAGGRALFAGWACYED